MKSWQPVNQCSSILSDRTPSYAQGHPVESMADRADVVAFI